MEFRPYANYQGEFGIDWVRLGDTAFPGDKDYREIIGSYHWSTRHSGRFRQSDSHYERYLRQFESFDHPIESDQKWYVPIVSLMQDSEAIFDLKMSIQDLPDRLEFHYNHDIFELSVEEIAPLVRGQTDMANFVSVKCLQQFDRPQHLTVRAGSHIVGKVKFLPNNRIKSIPFVPISVSIRLPGTSTTIPGGIREGAVEIVINQLKHAFCELDNSPSITLDLSNLTDEILQEYFVEEQGAMRVNIETDFLPFLVDQLSVQENGAYDDHLKFFLVDVLAGNYSTVNGQQQWGGVTGYAQTINSDCAVLLKQHYLFDASHEILHALGLNHSFSNNGDYTFKKLETDNVMDYSEIASPPISPYFTWAWQWKELNNSIEI